MNLKILAIAIISTDEPKIAYIEFEGEGVVTAADIQVDQDIEIMNPESVIAHLNGGADSKLYMELTITNGRGYVRAEKNKNEDYQSEFLLLIQSTLLLSVLTLL